jgi:hypothetical protein
LAIVSTRGSSPVTAMRSAVNSTETAPEWDKTILSNESILDRRYSTRKTEAGKLSGLTPGTDGVVFASSARAK